LTGGQRSLEPKAGEEFGARQELPELLVVDDLLIGREKSLEPKAGEELCVGQALPEQPELLILGNPLWRGEKPRTQSW
jgi:hypothetical protein